MLRIHWPNFDPMKDHLGLARATTSFKTITHHGVARNPRRYETPSLASIDSEFALLQYLTISSKVGIQIHLMCGGACQDETNVKGYLIRYRWGLNTE